MSVTEGNMVAGVNAVFSGDDVNFSYVILEKKKEELLLKKQQEEVRDYGHFKEWSEKNIPVSLALNGRGVIHKKVARSTNDTSLSLLHKVLPNASVNDFYMQLMDAAEEGQVFISVIRKETANAVIEGFKKQQIFVTRLCLGPFITELLLPLTRAANEIRFSQHYFTISDGKIADYSPIVAGETATIQIAEEKIAEIFFIPYAAAFSTLMGIEEPHAESEEVNLLTKEYEQKRTFQRNKLLVTGIFFFIAIINFIFFTRLSDTNEALSTQLALNQGLLTEFDSLKKHFEEKRTFVEQLGLMEADRNSYYADHIAISTPISVKLTLLNINPSLIKTNSNNEPRISFQQKIIQVGGLCNKSTDLNDWIKKIKQLTWVKDVSLKHYSRDKAMESGEFNFEIAVN